MHALLSLQAVPFALLGLLHLPVPASHVPALLHWSLAAHTTGVPALQEPAWHASFCVHCEPSSQAVPSALLGLLHLPVAALQVPALWHWSLAVHVTGLLPTQVPLWHVSVWVHNVPSLQAEPFGLIGSVHAPVLGLQVPAL